MAIGGETAGQPGWTLDELSSAGRENLDAGHARRYDRKEDADARAEVALLRSWGLNEEATVVDLGAGTGQFAIAVAPVCRRVIAVDVSPVMLAVLREKARAASVANIDVVQAGFLTYEHTGRPADLVYSRWALHHLPDFWKVIALERLHRMLAPGGILRLSDVIYGFPLDEAEERLESWCATGDEPGRTWTRAEIEAHVRDEHSTFTWLLEPMIERSGFEIAEAAFSADQFFAMYVLVARAGRLP